MSTHSEPSPAPEDNQSSSFIDRHPLLTYTAARLGILVACFGVAFALGARELALILIAFIMSALLSFVLLGKLRDRVGAGVNNHFEKLNTEVEDADEESSQEVGKEGSARQSDVTGETNQK